MVLRGGGLAPVSNGSGTEASGPAPRAWRRRTRCWAWLAAIEPSSERGQGASSLAIAARFLAIAAAFAFVGEDEESARLFSRRVELLLRDLFAVDFASEAADRLGQRVDVLLVLGAEAGAARAALGRPGQRERRWAVRRRPSASSRASACVERSRRRRPFAFDGESRSLRRRSAARREERRDRSREGERDSVRCHGSRKPMIGPREALAELAAEVHACRRCPRLVAWREACADDPPRRFRGEEYWARPVAGFGDPAARVAIVGLAPAAHGANRTGRMFTGDRSGDWLYAALHRAGFANQAEVASAAATGCACSDAYVTAVVRCAPPANRPTPGRARQLPPLLGARAGAAGALPASSSPSAPSPGTAPCGRCALSAPRFRGRDPSSATAPRPPSATGRCSAATTRASRTPSPAG